MITLVVTMFYCIIHCMVNVLNFHTLKCLTKWHNVNSVNLDQTAPEGAVWLGSTLFSKSLSILGNNWIKSKSWAKKSIE